MISSRLFVSLALLGGLATAASASAADGKPPEPGMIMKRPETDFLLSVDFGGGSLAALVDTINNKRDGPSFNVIGEKADFAVELPPFVVRQVSVSSLAAALDLLLSPRGYRLDQPNTAPGSTPVFILRKRPAGAPLPEPIGRNPRSGQFQAFQLTAYLKDQTVDDIISAIRAAWALNPLHKPDDLRLQFHPPTKILLVSGPLDTFDVIPSTLAQLRRDPSAPPTPSPAQLMPAPLPPTSAEEERRMQAVAAEIARRKDARDAQRQALEPGNLGPPANPPPARPPAPSNE